MIAALNKGKIVAPMTFEGYCDTEVFNGWFEQFLAPILQPGQTVILDNATFHKSKKIVEFAKKGWCRHSVSASIFSRFQ